MCLKPITLRTPSKYINLHGGQLYTMQVPCGQCAECKKLLQTEYRFRAYYQVLDTFNQGGYVYFDTLTYAPEHLPHVSEFLHDVKDTKDDYSCFRLDDYRKFFVRLRRTLKYHGFNPADNLKYFLTSEYGTSDEGTHRPHYHILFFVTDSTLDPFVLSHLVNKCWQLGRTDGIDWKSRNYVEDHIFRLGCDQPHLLNVCNYVAKYVTKDSSFEKVVNKRIDKCLSRVKDESDLKSTKRQLKNLMCQFHRQSQGFGEYGLVCNSIDDIMETGMLKMPSTDEVVVHTPLSPYFKRKLFYDLVNINGKREWQLNDLGAQFLAKRKIKSVEYMANALEDWFTNISNFVDQDSEPLDDSFGTMLDKKLDYSKFGISKPTTSVVDDYRNYAMQYLGDRTWKDFAIYLQLYKGRIIPNNVKGLPTFDEMLKCIIDSYKKNTDFVVYQYGTSRDRINLGSKFVCNHFHGDSQDGYDDDLNSWITNRRFNKKGEVSHRILSDYEYYVRFLNNKSYKDEPKVKKIRELLLNLGVIVSQKDFAKYYCIDESTFECFHDFDKLYNIYCKSLRQYNKKKQEAYDEKLRLQELAKKMKGYKRNI